MFKCFTSELTQKDPFIDSSEFEQSEEPGQSNNKPCHHHLSVYSVLCLSKYVVSQ